MGEHTHDCSLALSLILLKSYCVLVVQHLTNSHDDIVGG